MRVVTRFRPDERGASAVVVSLSLVAVFGAAMLSIDAGELWRDRRTILTATDAAALAEARAVALSPAATRVCTGIWTDLLRRNAGTTAEPVSCDVRPGSTTRYGSVEVQARMLAPVRFGKVLGVEDQHPFASSIARYGPLDTVDGPLRPMGICSKSEHLAEWLAALNGGSMAAYDALRGSSSSHPVYPGAGVVHRVNYTKDHPDDCGEAPGNWGFMDFDGGRNSNADLRDWILTGYTDNAVSVGDCNADNRKSGEPCPADPGSSGGSIDDTLDDIVGKPFGIPLFDLATMSGSNVEYRISGFLGVILRGYRVTGGGNSRYLDLEFVKLIMSGPCCNARPPGLDTGVRGVRLCSVDHDPIDETTRCG